METWLAVPPLWSVMTEQSMCVGPMPLEVFLKFNPAVKAPPPPKPPKGTKAPKQTYFVVGSKKLKYHYVYDKTVDSLKQIRVK